MKGYVTSEAITRGDRITLSSGNAAVAGAGEEGIGTARNSADSGDTCTVILDHRSVEVVASGTIAAGGDCYAAASGAVSATISGRRIGIALEAGTDTNYFEMMLAGVNS